MNRSREEPQPAHALRIGFELRLDAGDGIELAAAPEVHHCRRIRRADDRGVLQFARQEEIVGAADDDADARARAIHVRVAAKRRRRAPP